MDEKSRETWDVSLSAPSSTQMATIGARCRRCDHEHRWAIDALIAEHKPWGTVVELAP
jgi:hypothetical protein